MSRGVSPLLGLTLLLGITITAGAALGLVVMDGIALTTAQERPVRLSVTASTDDSRLILRHEAGPAIDVRNVTIHVAIDGTALARQPPVPFFAATGFASGPTGPFNPATDPIWSVGERASFGLASTNRPQLRHGSTVVIRVERNGKLVVQAETSAT